MSTDQTSTVRELVSDALLDLEAARLGTPPDAKEMDLGIRHLNRIMKTWQGNGSQFLRARGTLTLTDSEVYTLSPVVRPIRIIDARLRQVSTIETPMFRMNRAEYDNLPQKLSTGLPTQFYYDRQKENALFYVWPVLATSAVNGQTIEYSYEREFEDVTDPDEVLDAPVEWYDAIVSELAARLCPAFGSLDKLPVLQAMAKEKLDTALGSDTEESVYWKQKYE